MPPRFRAIDKRIGQWMETYGHISHRYALGLLFIWFGLLKPFGYKTTTSLLAHTVYWGSPEVVVPVLGWWEVAIGLCLLLRPLNRLGLFLLALRLVGTVTAFFMLPEVCFEGNFWVPTPEGQYLIKDLVLFTAAMLIGGTVHAERAKRVIH